MNRREMLASVSEVLATAGVTGATAKAFDPEPVPLLLRVTLSHEQSEAERIAMMKGLLPLRRLIEQRTGEPVSIVVLHKGVELDVVVDPRAASVSRN